MRDLFSMQIKEVNGEFGFNFTVDGSPIEVMTGMAIFFEAMAEDIDVPFDEMLAMIKVIKEEDEIDG